MFNHAVVCNECRAVGSTWAPWEKVENARAMLRDIGWVCNSPMDLCPKCVKSMHGFAEATKLKKDA